MQKSLDKITFPEERYLLILHILGAPSEQRSDKC